MEFPGWAETKRSLPFGEWNLNHLGLRYHLYMLRRDVHPKHVKRETEDGKQNVPM